MRSAVAGVDRVVMISDKRIRIFETQLEQYLVGVETSPYLMRRETTAEV
jgi:hypothetical protein